MNKKLLALTIFTLFSNNALASASYLCITDLVSGFYYDEGLAEWQQTTFLPGEKFMVTERRQNVFDVRKLDTERSWSAKCTVRADLTEDSFSCTSGTNQFHFNRKLLRFTSFRLFGYWNGSNDSLSMSVGECFPN